MQKCLLILLLVFILPQMVIAQNSIRDYYIKRVDIQINNVFSEDEIKENKLRRLSNAFHSVTKEKVIKRELLFAESDELDIELIEESERNLRSLYFLEKVTIDIDTVSNDSVIVRVTTIDQWSLVPSVVIEGGGGIYGLGASLEESNLLGYGKTLDAEFYNESDIGTSYAFGYNDYQTFGTHWESYISIFAGPLNNSIYLGTGRPLYSSDTKWSTDFDYYNADEIIRLFNDGEEITRMGEKSEGVFIEGAYSFGERYKKKHIYLKYRYEDKRYNSLDSISELILPENELVSATTVEYSFGAKHYAKENRIDFFKKVEDLKLGYRATFSIGKAGFPIPTGKDWFEYEVDFRYAAKIKKSNYLFLNAAYESQEVQNIIYSFNSQFYSKPTTWQTLAFNIDFKYAEDLVYSRQFLLGGQNGLRGYKAREFGGDKQFLINIEDRFFTNIELFTVSLGFVAFVDIGNVWEREKAMNFSDLNYSTGAGLRLGYTKITGAPVVRIDVGWPIEKNRAPGISFGVSQWF